MAIRVQDSFSDVAGTDLANHTGEVGATWTRRTGGTGTIVITDANRIRHNTASTLSFYMASGQLGDEQDIVSEWLYRSDINDIIGIFGRSDGPEVANTSNNYYRATYTTDAAKHTLFLTKVVNGTLTTLQSVQVGLNTAGTTYRVTLQIRGAAKKVFVGTTEHLSNTDDTVPLRAYSGVFFSSGSTVPTDTTGIHHDLFEASDTVTATTHARTVPQTARVSSVDIARTVPQAARVGVSGLSRTVPQTARIQATTTRTVPQRAAISTTDQRTVPQTGRVGVADLSRTVPQTGRVGVADLSRTVPQTGRVGVTDQTRTVPQSATISVGGTFTRTVPQTAGVSVSDQQRIVSQTARVSLVGNQRVVPQTAAVSTVSQRTIPQSARVETPGLMRVVPQTAGIRTTGHQRTVPQAARASVVDIQRIVPQSATISTVAQSFTRTVPQAARIAVNDMTRIVPQTATIYADISARVRAFFVGM